MKGGFVVCWVWFIVHAMDGWLFVIHSGVGVGVGVGRCGNLGLIDGWMDSECMSVSVSESVSVCVCVHVCV